MKGEVAAAAATIRYYKTRIGDLRWGNGTDHTCCGIEIKDGVVYIQDYHFLPLPWGVQNLYLCILYPLSEPLL